MNDKEALFNLIGEKVFRIRGYLVILDRDLAGLYGVETKRLNESVRRHIKRLENEDTMFQLTQLEYSEILRSQFATLGWGKYSKFLPYAFTELGIAKLSSILESDIAIRVNDQIMRYFIQARKLESKNDDFRKYVEANFKFIHEKLKKTDISIEAIFSLLDSYQSHKEIPYKTTGKIGFKKTKDDAKHMEARKVRCAEAQQERKRHTK